MKKVLLISTMMVFTLAVGLAYAVESYPMGEPGSSISNGITYFETGPALDCRSESGSGAGGMSSVAEPGPAVSNGVTLIDLGRADSGAKGACASGSGMEEQGLKVDNGITYFSF